MKKLGLKNLIRKSSAGIVATILVFTITIGAIMTVSNLTLAADSLPGISSIRSKLENDGVYTILEIVPDLKLAQFGYLVGGEEPLDVDTLYDDATKEWISWQEYLTKNVETMSEEQRIDYLEDVLVKYNGDYISVGSEPRNKPMWYEQYTEQGVTADNATGVLYGGNTPVYGWLIFKDTSDTEIGWNAKFTKIEGKTYTELLDETTPYYVVDAVQSNAEVVVTDEVLNGYPEYTYTYKKDVSGKYFIPSVTIGELKADIAVGGLVDDGEADDDLSNYYVVRFKRLAIGDFTETTGPAVYMASDIVYLDEKAPYKIPEQTEKGHSLIKPAKTVYYQGGLFSNEMFKQHTMDIDAADVSKYNVNVKTVTPGELKALSREDLSTYLSTIDFIYINLRKYTNF